MFLEDGDLLVQLAEMLKKDPAELPSYWVGIVARAHADAYQEIVGRLMARGYVKAQIDAWDRGAVFESDLTLYWALVRGGGLEAYSDLSIRPLDRRKDLDTVLLFVSGLPVNPGHGAGGPGTVNTGGPAIGVGAMGGGGSVFNYPDPDDPRLGQPTVW